MPCSRHSPSPPCENRPWLPQQAAGSIMLICNPPEKREGMDVSPLSSRLMVLLFTDVVNSAGIKADIGAEAYGQLVARQDRIVHHTISQTPGAHVLQDTG